MKTRALLVGLCCAIGAHGAATAQPSAYPTKTIKLIVSFPAGGGTDGAGRLFAQQLSAALGQPVVVENRPGAGGTIGATSVARAEPDGYTLLFSGESELTIQPITTKGLPYNPLADFQPIALIGEVPYVLVTNAEYPPNTLAEFIGYAKSNPVTPNFASFGTNSSNHLAVERFKLATGINAVHVPYKGSAPGVVDLVAGRVQFSFETPASTFQHIKAGKLKAIAVGTRQRLPSAPNLPTMTEAGLPDFLVGTYWGLLAPAKTPQPIIDRLKVAALAAIRSPELRKAYEERDIATPASTSPEEFRQFISHELAKWQELVAQGAIKPE